ncbi:MAG: hypothetical protein JRN15_00325, partial [Nitrososphaerota archaeon]|nr:hypothetical protein [Nitrososphaerota archaeon]
LIAIAAGVVVYAYVIGFIGNSTTNAGGAQSIVSIDNFCVSAAGTKCGYSSGVYASAVVRNVGSTSIAGALTANIYMTDATSGAVVTYTCTTNATSPGQTLKCNDTVSPGFAQGDSISMKIVMPDGGSSTSSTKALP